jgi:hypothetical protein
MKSNPDKRIASTTGFLDKFAKFISLAFEQVVQYLED